MCSVMNCSRVIVMLLTLPRFPYSDARINKHIPVHVANMNPCKVSAAVIVPHDPTRAVNVTHQLHDVMVPNCRRAGVRERVWK